MFLRACSAGAPCNDIAVALAQAVLNTPVVALAQQVLDDEEHRFARATELADAVLGESQAEAESTNARGRRS